MDKKGVELTMSTIAVAVLVLTVIVVLLITFTNLFGKQRQWLQDKIENPEGFLNDNQNTPIVVPLPLISFSRIINFFRRYKLRIGT